VLRILSRAAGIEADRALRDPDEELARLQRR
jgi:hypothetical protein